MSLKTRRAKPVRGRSWERINRMRRRALADLLRYGIKVDEASIARYLGFDKAAIVQGRPMTFPRGRARLDRAMFDYAQQIIEAENQS